MVWLIFLIIVCGILFGKIQVKGIGLGPSAVLLFAIAYGFAVGKGLLEQFDSIRICCSVLSSIGTAAFISAIGLEAGQNFALQNTRDKFKAFLGGASIVLIGFLITVMIIVLDRNVSTEWILGTFSGSMTSTPTLVAAQELCGAESMVTAGYGVSYCVGVLTVVLFVQSVRVKRCQSFCKSCSRPEPQKKKEDGIFLIALTAMVGSFLGTITILGTTAGMILIGMALGAFLIKSGRIPSDLQAVKQFGLFLFFIGSGILSGMRLTSGFMLNYALYGAIISMGSTVFGYFLLRTMFRFPAIQALEIVCGGMTSTPAIATMQNRYKELDISLYAVSYVGAIFSLILSVNILFLIKL